MRLWCFGWCIKLGWWAELAGQGISATMRWGSSCFQIWSKVQVCQIEGCVMVSPLFDMALLLFTYVWHLSRLCLRLLADFVLPCFTYIMSHRRQMLCGTGRCYSCYLLCLPEAAGQGDGQVNKYDCSSAREHTNLAERYMWNWSKRALDKRKQSNRIWSCAT